MQYAYKIFNPYFLIKGEDVKLNILYGSSLTFQLTVKPCYKNKPLLWGLWAFLELLELLMELMFHRKQFQSISNNQHLSLTTVNT